MCKNIKIKAEKGALPLADKCSRVISLFFIVIVGMLVSPANSNAGDPVTIDDLGFNAITDESLFSTGFKFQGNGVFATGNTGSVQLNTNFEAETVGHTANSFALESRNFLDISGEDNLDLIASSYKSQGFKLNRLSTSWQSKVGTFTVGNDWTNFQDLLSFNKRLDPDDIVANNRTVASQIKWLSPNGFSISLEESPKTSVYSSNDTGSDDDETGSSPSLILSWRGGPGGTAGEYSVSAMGKKLDATTSGQSFDGSDIMGWGLNLEGGWQIGDLFAALSVTFGKGINSYILQRYGDDLLVTPNNFDNSIEALSIQPSLYYSLNNNSNFHVSLGHYASEESHSFSGVDTLDTIHMGYSWSPWPSTKFGLELVGQNADGPNGVDEDSAHVKFGAETRF